MRPAGAARQNDRGRLRCDRGDGGTCRVHAPNDCTASDELHQLVTTAIAAIEERPTSVVLDLSETRSMNSLLLAAILWLAREAGRRGVQLRIAGIGAQFREWSNVCGIDVPLGRLRLEEIAPDEDPTGERGRDRGTQGRP